MAREESRAKQSLFAIAVIAAISALIAIFARPLVSGRGDIFLMIVLFFLAFITGMMCVIVIELVSLTEGRKE